MRKSLVKTLAVTMAAVMCAGMVSGCGAGSESKKADTQAEAPGTGDSKTADKSYELTVSGIGAALITFLSILRSRKAGLRKKDWILRRCCLPTARYRWNLFHLTAGISAAPAWAAFCRRSGIRCAGPWIQ